MDLIQKIKRIEQYVLENFEELDLDDPMEEGYWGGVSRDSRGFAERDRGF